MGKYENKRLKNIYTYLLIAYLIWVPIEFFLSVGIIINRVIFLKEVPLIVGLMTKHCKSKFQKSK